MTKLCELCSPVRKAKCLKCRRILLTDELHYHVWAREEEGTYVTLNCVTCLTGDVLNV